MCSRRFHCPRQEQSPLLLFQRWVWSVVVCHRALASTFLVRMQCPTCPLSTVDTPLLLVQEGNIYSCRHLLEG